MPLQASVCELLDDVVASVLRHDALAEVCELADDLRQALEERGRRLILELV